MTADDMISSPTRRPGYGDRTLFGPEGAIALNNNGYCNSRNQFITKG